MKIRSMQTCIMSSLPRCIFRCSVFRYVTLVSFFFLFFLFKLCYLIVTLLLWWRINTYLLTYLLIFMWRLLLIISTKLAGNSIGKFRLSVENSKNRILQILQTRLDLECSVKHSTDTCRCPLECQTAKPRIKHPWWSELFTCKMFLECKVID